MSFLAGASIFSIACALAVVLWFGTKDNEGGHVGPLPWGACILVSLLAGAAFQAAGFPFDIVSSMSNDLLKLVGATFPKLTLPGLALVLVIIALFKRLSRRGISMMMLFFFHVASGAAGPWGTFVGHISDAIRNVAAS